MEKKILGRPGQEKIANKNGTSLAIGMNKNASKVSLSLSR
jgi:hypothetical protein